jgi:hypothetical protein
MTDTTKPLRDALEKLSVHESWIADNHEIYAEGDPFELFVASSDDANDAVYIAAANPSMIRALLARLDAAEGALADAATSLETISRLAGRDTHSNGDATYMGTFSEVRGYAISRATASRAALTKGA